jgi:MSHA pilin protein MshC
MTVIVRYSNPMREERGFTMVELIIVMILIGVLSAIAVGGFFDRKSFDAAAFTEETRALLRYAQKAAIARNTPVWVELDDNRIGLCHVEPHGACPPESQVVAPGGTIGGADTETHCQSPGWFCIGRPEGIRVQVSQAINQFSFDGLGRPVDQRGPVSGLTLTITGDGQTNTVTVSEETGYVQ